MREHFLESTKNVPRQKSKLSFIILYFIRQDPFHNNITVQCCILTSDLPVVREDRRGEEYSERDKSLNKLLDVPWLGDDEGVDGGGSTGTTLVSSLYPPILRLTSHHSGKLGGAFWPTLLKT